MPIHHPDGECVNILGICANTNGRSCEEHTCCGDAVGLDTVLRLKVVQVLNEGREETAIAAYWVTDGIDRCRVGFLEKECSQNPGKYDGRLVQVIEFLSESDDSTDSVIAYSEENDGVIRAALIDCIRT